MLAMRLANSRPELDQSQFPDYVDEQIPTRRIDPAPGRHVGRKPQRPNNQQLHDNLGIQWPSYANTADSRRDQKLRNEDARGASRINWGPRQPSPPRSHGFVSLEEQSGRIELLPQCLLCLT